MSSLSDAEINSIIPKSGPSAEQVKKYLEKYNDEYIVIKCGGSVLTNTELYDLLINDISTLKKLGFYPVIIHGGGKKITEKLKELNIESNFINGLRVTDKDTIKVVEKVLSEFNKEIVLSLEKTGIKAQQFTSKDSSIIEATKENEELGYVGLPSKINNSKIQDSIKSNKIPVVAPLGIDHNNNIYNINADTAAGAIAKSLNARRLLILSDVEGVLDNQKNLISEINSQTSEELIKQEVITGGMIPKIKNCLDVASNGVKGVCIIDGRKPHSILFELLSDQGSGTLIRK